MSLKTELKTKTTLPPHLVCTSEAALWSVQDKVTGDHSVDSRSPIKPFSLALLECPPPAYQGGHCLSILGTAKKTQLMPPAPRSHHGDQPLAGAPAPPMTPHEVSWALELLSDTALVQGDDKGHPPARGEDHKTRDNQLNTSRTSPKGGGWRRASARGGTQGKMITTRTLANSQNYTKRGGGKKD